MHHGTKIINASGFAHAWKTHADRHTLADTRWSPCGLQTETVVFAFDKLILISVTRRHDPERAVKREEERQHVKTKKKRERDECHTGMRTASESHKYRVRALDARAQLSLRLSRPHTSIGMLKLTHSSNPLASESSCIFLLSAVLTPACIVRYVCVFESTSRDVTKNKRGRGIITEMVRVDSDVIKENRKKKKKRQRTKRS